MKIAGHCLIAAALVAAAPTASEARTARANSYDGAWHLSFVTRSGACDPSYDFDVNILNGAISHPNLVRFRGNVRPSGAVHASVTVQDKSASGSGRLSGARGQGAWRGRSGAAICAGVWTAQRT